MRYAAARVRPTDVFVIAAQEKGTFAVTVQIAVVDPLPLFRDGAAAALTAVGYTVQVPSDVVAWASQMHGAVVVLTVQANEDWAVLARLHEGGSAVNSVVALLEVDVAAAGVRAVRGGARSVLARRASAEMLQRTVAATIDGHAVVPAHVLAALAAGVGTGIKPAESVPAEKLLWLRALAEGSTVARLASQAGYSERAMFRLLRSLYREMGVAGRFEALMRAKEQGWL